MTNKEKFLALVKEKDTSSAAAIKWRVENRAWLKKSQAIALKILQTLKAKGSNQRELAEAIGVSAQQVNKWVKGNENFTLETLVKLEAALGVSLIEVSQESFTVKKQSAHLEMEAQRSASSMSAASNYSDKRKTRAKMIALNEPSTYYSKKKYA